MNSEFNAAAEKISILSARLEGIAPWQQQSSPNRHNFVIWA